MININSGLGLSVTPRLKSQMIIRRANGNAVKIPRNYHTVWLATL
jgi:hypothetical protein